MIHVLADRRHLGAFTTGCVAVTAGVLMHLPISAAGRTLPSRHRGWVLVPLLLSLALAWRYCTETRGRDLRVLDSAGAAEAGDGR